MNTETNEKIIDHLSNTLQNRMSPRDLSITDDIVFRELMTHLFESNFDLSRLRDKLNEVV